MTMSDEAALTALSLEYADAVRAQDGARWAATWADECRWVLDSERSVDGREAVLEMWSTAIAKYANVVQLYLSCVFDIDGDTASGRCEFMELNRTTEGAGKILAGHYTDTYVRTAAGWRYESRHLTKYYQGEPDLLGDFLG